MLGVVLMFFDSYPEITYKIGNKTVNIRDIFKNVAFVNTENNDAYYDYYVQDGETPEIIAAKVYGNTSYAWLILLVNNIADVKREWFISQEEYVKQNEVYFGGNAFYIETLPDIKSGDVIVKVTEIDKEIEQATAVDVGTFRFVADFDKTFRKVRGVAGSGTFSSNDNILFARKDDTGSIVPIQFKNTDLEPIDTNYTKALYVEPYGASVNYFYASNNSIINPYRYSVTGATAVQTNTIYSNPGDTLTVDNFAQTIIYKYGACGGTLPAGVFSNKVDINNYSKYIKRQKIKILRQDLLRSVLVEIKNALESNIVGKQFKINL